MLRPSNILYLYRVRLRSHWVQELLAVAGIAVGVALIFAALVANTSLTNSMRQLTEGIVGKADLQLAARGPDGFDQRLLGAVQRIEGVRSAAPILERRANLVGPDGRRSVLLIGGDPRFARLGGPLVRPFAAVGPSQESALTQGQVVALPAPLADSLGISFGAPIQLEADARTVDVPLGIQLQQKEIGAIANSPVALAPLGYAQRVGGMEGRLTRIFVESKSGDRQRVEAGLRRVANDRLNVRAADADVDVFEQAAYPTKQSTALFSGLSALVGFLFAVSAVLLTVPQRRAITADLRDAGHGTLAVVQLLLFDALVIGGVGSVVGLALGDQVSRHIFNEVPEYLSFTFSVGLDRAVSWQAVAIAGAAGLLAACVAVLTLTRDFRADALGLPELGDRHARGSLIAALAGLACLVLATVVVIAAPDAAMVGLVALTFALMLMLPLLLKGATAAFSALTHAWNTPVPTFVALELQATASRPRTLAVAATGALALFATVSIAGARADLQRGLDASTRDTVGNADIWITFPDAPNVLATTPFPTSRGRIETLEQLDGVRSVSPYRGSMLDVGDRRAWVLAPPVTADSLVPPSQIREGDPQRAERRLAAGGWVVLSDRIAEGRGVTVGDRVKMPFPVPTTLRVAAVSTNLGWAPGAILLNADDYARAWGDDDPSALHVDLAAGVRPEFAKHVIQRKLRADAPLMVETAQERVDLHYAASRDGLSRLTQISAVVLVAAILAMAIAMGGMIWQRRPTIAALKVHGYSESKLWRALLLESGILLGTGCLVGAGFGLYGQILLSRALETITGFPVSYSMAVLAAGGILALVTAVALAMLAIPGWLAVRVRAAPGVPR